ncbi:MAG: hypothetical protein ABIG55_02645 [Candidatus Omnitrophota bacterium]|nr:hypothetical protein [Candidatus Omnitrophota bacterium]
MKNMIIMLSMFIIASAVSAEEPPIKFDCEKSSTLCWAIPEWSLSNDSYVGVSTSISADEVSQGAGSLKVMCDFPGDKWAAVIVECEKNIDLTGYKKISADIYLPQEAVSGLIQARFILTVGEWQFLESKREVMLTPGKWTKIEAEIGGERFRDEKEWKCPDKEECLVENISDVKSMGIRIEYNANLSQSGPAYNGPIYIDNIIVE